MKAPKGLSLACRLKKGKVQHRAELDIRLGFSIQLSEGYATMQTPAKSFHWHEITAFSVYPQPQALRTNSEQVTDKIWWDILP